MGNQRGIFSGLQCDLSWTSLNIEHDLRMTSSSIPQENVKNTLLLTEQPKAIEVNTAVTMLKWQLTFTFVGGFIQDGLRWHDLAIPTRGDRVLETTWSMTDEVISGQREETAPSTCRSIPPHFTAAGRNTNKQCFAPSIVFLYCDLKCQGKICLPLLHPPVCLSAGVFVQ